MSNDYLTVKEVQTRMLEMLDVLLEYFEAHNYHFVLTGGSALGAVRHSSMIPWDDDMDIALPREEYEKFIGQFESANSQFELKNERQSDWGYAYARLSDKSTEYMYQWGNVDNGIFIDIFPIDHLPDSKIGQLSTYAMMKSLDVVRNAARRTNYQPHERFVALKKVMVILLKPVSSAGVAHCQSRLARLVDRLCAKSGQSGLYVVEGINGLREVNATEIYRRTKDGNFNGRHVKIPSNSTSYLTKLYGANYMDLPPVEQRKTHGKFKTKNILLKG